REIAQKLFLGGKMATPKAIELAIEKEIPLGALLGVDEDIIDEAAVLAIPKHPSSKNPVASGKINSPTASPEKEVLEENPGPTKAAEAEKVFTKAAKTYLDVTPTQTPPKEPQKAELVRDRKKRLAEEYSVDFRLENRKIAHKERKAPDFTNYFNSRFQMIQGMLAKRLNPMSISNLTKINADSVSILGMVNDIRTTNNGNKMLVLEDPTGSIPCIVSKDKDENLSEESNNTLMDEVIGVNGSFKNGLFFVKEIVRPGIPVTNGVNRLDVPLKAVFISDIHYGSAEFIEPSFKNFIKWMNSPKADAVKYIFIAGDLCDGIGIYIGQENDLVVRQAELQYSKLAALLEGIPSHVKIIISPGNHDIIGNHEPQQLLDYTGLSKLPNAVFGTNPCSIVLQNKLRILMYHGYSYDTFISELPRIRHDGYDKPCLPMIEALKRRHLSPSYGGSLIIPEHHDCLVIEKVPDIFHSGHLHTVGLENHHNVTLINSGTFQGKTSFQERMGHHPHPGIFACVDLQTRKAELIDVN
ncbi:MAG: metallophosphoesterase, partial [Candidatus Aenigmatarchaeota archaeon]